MTLDLKQLAKDTEGWCSLSKSSLLMDLVTKSKAQLVVEVGVYGGRSFIPMAWCVANTPGGKAVGIDPWIADESIKGQEKVNHDWWGALDHDKIYKGFISALYKYLPGSKVSDSVSIMRMTSQEAAHSFAPGSIDLLHIDGNHSEETALQDVKTYIPLMKPGGVVVFDDADWPQTAKAIEELKRHCNHVEYHYPDVSSTYIVATVGCVKCPQCGYEIHPN